ncbi:MAG: tetratricopeptide repeat protein [Bryobacteraceae bacterium]
MKLGRIFVLILFVILPLAADSDPFSEAMAALQGGDLFKAEGILRARLRDTPNDATALAFLGVVLDQEKKYPEADEVYRRAIAGSPRSSALLNNYGNHLVVTGKLNEARPIFSRVLALDPAQVNARVQLARIALERKSAAEALSYLDRLPANTQQGRDVMLLRMQALYELHRDKEADDILALISPDAKNEPRFSFSVGVALAAVSHYEQAEIFFDRAVEASPENFDALYDLGLAASHAGHRERAREVLQRAIEKQPDNVDVLYDLAAVDALLNQKEIALELLARAARLAPDRADVHLLLAHTSADLGYFGDSEQAWARYMKLVPSDDVGRREHAFAESALGENRNAGMADLEWFVRKHPNDAVGHYELGIANGPANANEALRELDRALALNPDLAAAHLARGVLKYRQGQAAAALSDFEFAAGQDPTNPTILDRLGETYSKLGRPTDALENFRKAAELAPRDSTILLHFGRALVNAGQADEAKPVFARLRELGPSRAAAPHPAGLVDFLSLSPDEQLARYRAGVERTVQKNPDNAEAQVRYLQLMLGDGKTAEAEVTARKILTLKPSAALLTTAADALLAAEKYSLAADFLAQAVGAASDSYELRLDLAIATFHVSDASAGLSQLHAISKNGRNGDYYLADFLMLQALGREQDAASALEAAFEARPTRPELYRQASLVLMKHGRAADAQHLLDEGARILPNDPEITLMRASAEVP